MAAPFLLHKKRPRGLRRHAHACGRAYVETAYHPSYALGIVCRDESEQRKLFARLRKIVPEHEIKVLVI